MSTSSSARDCGQKRSERKRGKQWPGSETKAWRGWVLGQGGGGHQECDMTYQKNWQVNSHLLRMHNEGCTGTWHSRSERWWKWTPLSHPSGALFFFLMPAFSCNSLCIRWEGPEVVCIKWAPGLCWMTITTLFIYLFWIILLLMCKVKSLWAVAGQSSCRIQIPY